MQTLSNKARQGRLNAIANMSNRRAASRHFSQARLSVPLLSMEGKVISPEHFQVH